MKSNLLLLKILEYAKKIDKQNDIIIKQNEQIIEKNIEHERLFEEVDNLFLIQLISSYRIHLIKIFLLNIS